MTGRMLLLDGGAHPELTSSIADYYGHSIVDAKISHFPDGETDIIIHDDVRDQDVFIIQPTGNPANDNILNLLLITDALRRSSAGRITAVMPYYGYARQDRKEASRQPISAKLIANLLLAAGVNRIMSIDLHSRQIQGFTDLPLDHLSAEDDIAKYMVENQIIEHPVVVGPDSGAIKKAKKFARLLHTQWAFVDKDRLDGRTTNVDAVISQQTLVGRNALIVDDMISTADTTTNAARALKEAGVLKVIAAATHGVLCENAVDRIESCDELDFVYVTDTLPAVISPKIGHITIAPLLAKGINHIHEGLSLSKLFQNPEADSEFLH